MKKQLEVLAYVWFWSLLSMVTTMVAATGMYIYYFPKATSYSEFVQSNQWDVILCLAIVMTISMIVHMCTYSLAKKKLKRGRR